MNDVTTDPCPPPGQPCREIDRLLELHEDVRRCRSELEKNSAETAAARRELAEIRPLLEHANHVATVAAKMLPALERKTEDTMAETRQAREAQAGVKAAQREQEARIERHEQRLAELAEARAAGAEGGRQAASSWRSQRKSLAAAVTALVVALTAALPQLVQSCESRSAHAHPAAAPAVSR